ncbi:hypothetical protein DFA_03839 [Cavenderia fasciculata]|uniref:Uncharacterized protein n=1 Tax=Cavenderia fasciculata TaxID=261658 RepID=F4Q0J4_CACFS|nr:uncharacterized protein DFA_03839 [Cavenderia fasciculata]EGG18345.1 hypothetical protein DFA_03839 [Cavenderia fasciculata]|eukprot:XP_004366249.1 hypothetical protein DFA_03839 [Cavenderia fasciculata]
MDVITSYFEFYNDLEKQWIVFRDKGTKTMNQMVNDHLKQSFIDAYQWPASIKDNHIIQNQLRSKMFDSISLQYQRLYSCYSELSSITDKLNQKVGQLELVVKERSSGSSSRSISTTLLAKYSEQFKLVIAMYTKSLDNKKSIIETLLSIYDRDQLVTLVSCWQNDIHIDRSFIETTQDMMYTEISLSSSSS